MKTTLAILAVAGATLTGCVAVPYDRPTPRGYSGGYSNGYSPGYSPGYYGRGDRDRDGVPNRYDRDRDNDGVPNRYDRRPNNPYRN